MSYPIISADFARNDLLPDIGEVIYLGSLQRHPEYAAWEHRIVTLRDEGELEAEARLIRFDEQWYGVLIFPIRDISPDTLRENDGVPRLIAS
jgi:hypothetical protein